MLYAPIPKSRKITGCKLTDGILYLESDAARHRIIPLSEDIVRISYTSNGSFCSEEKPAVILRSIYPNWNLSHKDRYIVFSSDRLCIKIDSETASYSYFDNKGNLLLSERRKKSRELDEFTAYKSDDLITETVNTADGEKTVVSQRNKTESGRFFHTRLHLCFSDNEAIYGLGQHEEGFMNLRGKTVYSYQANRKISIPMMVSSKGWGLLIDTYSPLIFNDNEYGTYIYTEADSEMDFYFINGGSPDGAIKGYRVLTGKAELLPKWAFGYMQSQERYESFEEIIETVKEFRRRNIGLDCIIQDWCSWPSGKWGQKEFDPVCYPNPYESIKQIHDNGARFMLSIWPNPNPGTKDYEEFNRNGMMLATKDFYNAFDENARRLYWEQVNKKLFCHGIDAWWCDNSEPFSPEWNYQVRHEEGRAYEDFVAAASDRFDADKLCSYPFWHASTLYDGQRSSCCEKRVVNLTRCAHTGQQRLSCILWSGDTSASWETYRKQIASGLNFSASGLPYWTMDIGGFFVKDSVSWYWDGDFNDTCSNPEYCELYVRWYQWGAFLPIFRAHGTDLRREPWTFEMENDSSFYDAIVKVNHLRYELIPYIYSAAADTYFNDRSIIRPLAFEFTQDPMTADIKDQYMFGSSMMVCPVTRPMYYGEYADKTDMDTSIEVYLPRGCDWYLMSNGKRYKGGRYTKVNAPLDEIPIFIKAGSIIPTTDFKPTVTVTDNITYIVYPGADAEYTLYEDSGDGYGYMNGEYTLTKLEWHDKKQELIADNGTIPSFMVVSTQ